MRPTWEELANLLHGRVGWHCDIVNGLELSWQYGDLDQSAVERSPAA